MFFEFPSPPAYRGQTQRSHVLLVCTIVHYLNATAFGTRIVLNRTKKKITTTTTIFHAADSSYEPINGKRCERNTEGGLDFHKNDPLWVGTPIADDKVAACAKWCAEDKTCKSFAIWWSRLPPTDGQTAYCNLCSGTKTRKGSKSKWLWYGAPLIPATAPSVAWSPSVPIEGKRCRNNIKDGFDFRKKHPSWTEIPTVDGKIAACSKWCEENDTCKSFGIWWSGLPPIDGQIAYCHLCSGLETKEGSKNNWLWYGAPSQATTFTPMMTSFSTTTPTIVEPRTTASTLTFTETTTVTAKTITTSPAVSHLAKACDTTSEIACREAARLNGYSLGTSRYPFLDTEASRINARYYMSGCYLTLEFDALFYGDKGTQAERSAPIDDKRMKRVVGVCPV